MRRIDCEQYSKEWWDVRRGVPSASCFKRIITPAKWELAAGAETYAEELVADLYDPYYGLRDNQATPEMRAGTMAEPEHRKWYEARHDCTVDQVGFCLTDCGRFGCSPDGLIGDDGGLEIKRPQPRTQIAYLRAGVVPQEYLAQVHGGLYVTGRAWWDFLSICPGLPSLCVRVEPGDLTLRLGEVLGQFHEKLQAIKHEIEVLHRI